MLTLAGLFSARPDGLHAGARRVLSTTGGPDATDYAVRRGSYTPSRPVNRARLDSGARRSGLTWLMILTIGADLAYEAGAARPAGDHRVTIHPETFADQSLSERAPRLGRLGGSCVQQLQRLRQEG
jgi:hypothetical protein